MAEIQVETNEDDLGKHYALNALNKVARQQILDNLRRYSTEERLLALILHTMLRQLDEQDLNLKYVAKNIRHLKKLNRASRYAPKIIDASNRVWKDSFTEMTVNVSIADFASIITFKRKAQFKKMNVNASDFGKLQKTIEGVTVKEEDGVQKVSVNSSGYTFTTTRLVNLMLDKIDKEVELLNKEVL